MFALALVWSISYYCQVYLRELHTSRFLLHIYKKQRSVCLCSYASVLEDIHNQSSTSWVVEVFVFVECLHRVLLV